MTKLIKIKIFKNLGVPVEDSDMLDAAVNPDGILRAVEHKFFYRTRGGDIITRTGARLSLRTEAVDCCDDYFTTATVEQLKRGADCSAGVSLDQDGAIDLEDLEEEEENEDDGDYSETGDHGTETGTQAENNVPCPAQGDETYIVPAYVVRGSGGLARGVLLVLRKKRKIGKEKDLSKI